MALQTELVAIIKKIKEQRNDIIDKIKNHQASKKLQQIEGWIEQQIGNEFSSNNIQLLAIIIDLIHQYIKNEFDKEKTSLVENCLTNLINNWSNLPEHKILAIIFYLKAYVKTNDVDAQFALEEFIGKSGRSIGFFQKKIVSFCVKSLSNLSIKTEFDSLSAIELATEAGLPNRLPFFKDASSGKFIDNPAKKIKARIIEFDEDEIGYDTNSSWLYFKEINRLNTINLEIEIPEKIEKKLLQERLLNKELERLAKIEVNQESYLNKSKREIKKLEFDFFTSQEEKNARQCNLEQKIEKTKKNRERRKISKLLIPKILSILKRINIYKKAFGSQSLSIEPFLFETHKDDFLIAFLKTINYEKFKELINFSEYILISIDKIKGTLKKIDDFSEGLGVASNYVSFLDNYHRMIKENFNRENIGNFLENSLILFELRTLALDNNYCLLDRPDKKNEIVFSESAFLDEFISAYNSKQIYKNLSNEINQFLNKKRENLISIGNKNLKSKTSLIKRFFSFFSEEYYFTSKKFKKKFIKKIFSNFSEPSSVEAMKTILNNLKWWQFLLFHIGIIFLLRKRFRARLAEELFLDLLEEKFKKISEKQEPNAKNIDELYNIKNHINSLKSKIQDHSIDLNSLSPLDSRQAIIGRLKGHKEIERLLDNVMILSNRASSCVEEFNNLKDAYRRESDKISEVGETSQFNKDGIRKYIFS